MRVLGVLVVVRRLMFSVVCVFSGIVLNVILGKMMICGGWIIKVS
jgi:hypothetical protein